MITNNMIPTITRIYDGWRRMKDLNFSIVTLDNNRLTRMSTRMGSNYRLR